MRLSRFYKWLVGLAGGVLLATACLLSICWYSGIWTPRQYEVYREMSRECHPVWRDLWHRRIVAGDDLDSVLLRTFPVRVERFGRYSLVNYQGGRGHLWFTGVTVTAKDGRLVSASAWSCCWSHCFFDEMTSADKQELQAAWDAGFRKRREDEAEASSIRAVTLVGLLASPVGETQLLWTMGATSE